MKVFPIYFYLTFNSSQTKTTSMGSHPINLLFRFLLEILAFLAIGFWGYHQSEAWLGLVLAVLIPIGVAVIWGVFNVPNDPSRSGNAPVMVPGLLRLLLEFGIFGFAAWSLYDVGHNRLAVILAGLVIIHYLLSLDRIKWLLAR